jgi:hypothetical protein
MNFSRALTICGRLVELPGNAGLELIARTLAKRRGVIVDDRESMKAIIVEVAESNAGLIIKQTKAQRKAARANLESIWGDL